VQLSGFGVSGIAALWDWRRRIADLYRDIRACDDPLAAWRQWRDARDEMFASHPQTPLESGADFAGLDYFPYDPGLRFLVGLSPLADAGIEEFPAGEDGVLHMRPFAQTAGLRASLGGELTLYWITGYGGGVFLPFADATSSRETFGAGRYLLDTIKGADLGQADDGRTVLDFNFAYCPSCAYSPRWICPLAPLANRLKAPVRAGERS
jgi:uncharacterized protein